MSLRNRLLAVVTAALLAVFCWVCPVPAATSGIENLSNIPTGWLYNYLANLAIPISGATKNLFFPQGSPLGFTPGRATIVTYLCVGIYAPSTLGTAGPMTFQVFTGAGAGTGSSITETLATSTASGSYCDSNPAHTATIAANTLVFVKWTGNGSTNTAGPVTSMYLRFQ